MVHDSCIALSMAAHCGVSLREADHVLNEMLSSGRHWVLYQGKRNDPHELLNKPSPANISDEANGQGTHVHY